MPLAEMLNMSRVAEIRFAVSAPSILHGIELGPDLASFLPGQAAPWMHTMSMPDQAGRRNLIPVQFSHFSARAMVLRKRLDRQPLLKSLQTYHPVAIEHHRMCWSKMCVQLRTQRFRTGFCVQILLNQSMIFG